VSAGKTVSAGIAGQDHSPLISVIVTCFNQEGFIRDAVDSVLNQSWKKLECIIVDDGSTDNSCRVIQELQAADERIRVILQSNAGVSAARNAGFREAGGAFIQFLDGDDLLGQGKLAAHLRQFADAPECSVAYGDHDFLDMRTGRTTFFGTTRLDAEPLKQMLTQWFDGASLPIHAGLFRRSIWGEGEVPFPTDYGGRCEDWIFLVNVAKRGAIFCGLPVVLCTYRVGVAGFTDSSLKWNVSALEAAVYINAGLDSSWQQRFLRDFFSRTLQRYVQLKKGEILHASWNWKLGNALTLPVFRVLKLARRLKAGWKARGGN
jgi:glycosyltransferase involved in cell wall biosynthesis